MIDPRGVHLLYGQYLDHRLCGVKYIDRMEKFFSVSKNTVKDIIGEIFFFFSNIFLIVQ